MDFENYETILAALCWGETQAELLHAAGKYDKSADLTLMMAKARAALEEENKIIIEEFKG